jgi:Spy/CpxP family protein refolding chaperone
MRRQHGPAIRSLGANLRETRRALTEALLADSVDVAHVKRLGADLGRHEAERVMLRFEIEAGVLSILTPDQAREYRELRRERREGMTRRPAARGLDRP